MTCEAIFCFDTATVRFAIYPDGFEGPRIVAQIAKAPKVWSRPTNLTRAKSMPKR